MRRLTALGYERLLDRVEREAYPSLSQLLGERYRRRASRPSGRTTDRQRLASLRNQTGGTK